MVWGNNSYNLATYYSYIDKAVHILLALKT